MPSIARGGTEKICVCHIYRVSKSVISFDARNKTGYKRKTYVLLQREVQNMDHTQFAIDSEIRKRYRRFNAVGMQLTVRLLPPSDPNMNITSHFQDSAMHLLDYALRSNSDSDMFGIVIRNVQHQQDKPTGLSFRRKYQILSDAIWSVFEKAAQTNSRFNATDPLVFEVQC